MVDTLWTLTCLAGNPPALLRPPLACLTHPQVPSDSTADGGSPWSGGLGGCRLATTCLTFGWPAAIDFTPVATAAALSALFAVPRVVFVAIIGDAARAQPPHGDAVVVAPTAAAHPRGGCGHGHGRLRAGCFAVSSTGTTVVFAAVASVAARFTKAFAIGMTGAAVDASRQKVRGATRKRSPRGRVEERVGRGGAGQHRDLPVGRARGDGRNGE